ncbi:hypothetical protein VKI21_12535 [Cyanobacterium aponinum UTEX 3222]|uniref:hypothetical protein n=1 Tax=Cyanobacterium aponinum TaxID=379064 RepID=UPI003086A33F|nr:hypothetical protein VKI21_12535 [Cyanobacterium aponinum UTEX 3222]
MNKKLQKWREKAEEQRLNNFLLGFRIEHLQKVVLFYDLTCADWKQKRCLVKTIRESKLTYQQIWKPIMIGLSKYYWG